VSKTNSEKRSLGERVNTWVQTVGICIAAVWGFYTFVYEKITVPKSAPVNVTLNLQLKKIGSSASKAGLTAVEMKASATNPSSREIHLLPSAWIAYGVSVTAAENDDAVLNQKALKALRDTEIVSTVQRHAKQASSSIVAMGPLFFDNALEPGETLVRNVVFYVPIEKYDLLNLVSLMPNTPEDTSRIEFEWALNGKILEGKGYHLDKNGKRIPEKGKEGAYSEAKVDLTEANTQISLWPEAAQDKSEQGAH
jgi:hypothetical protein